MGNSILRTLIIYDQDNLIPLPFNTRNLGTKTPLWFWTIPGSSANVDYELALYTQNPSVEFQSIDLAGLCQTDQFLSV